MRQLSRAVAMAAFIFLFVVNAGLSFAIQEMPKKAAIAFEFKPQQLLESELAQALNLADGLKGEFPTMVRVFFDAESVKGVVSLPEGLASFLEARQSLWSPADFFIQASFPADYDLAEMKDELTRNSEIREEGGVTYYSPSVGETNLYVAFSGTNTFTLGTTAYQFDEKNFKNVTAKLQTTIGKWTSGSAMVAMDFDSARGLIDEGIEMAKQGAPPMVLPFFAIPSQISLMQMSADLDADQIMSLTIESPSSEEAEMLQETLQGLIGMGKMGLMSAPQDDPSVALVGKILNSMKLKVEGKTVSMFVVKPEGLDKVIAATRAAAVQMSKATNDLKRVGLSMHNYHDVHKKLPFNAANNQSADLSWRVRVLPFLDQESLAEQFNLEEAWNSQQNKPLSEIVVPLFGEDAKTGIQWVKSEVNSFGDITDGMFNTIALLVSPSKVTWTEPKDLSLEEAVKVYLALKPEQPVGAVFYDGSVQWIGAGKFTPDEFRALLTPAGGEIIVWDKFDR